MSKLFKPFVMGGRTLANRIAMAPLTRSRARPGNVSSELAPLYYGQRAGAGLIVTEGTAISPSAIGYLDVPGLWNADQVAGWKPVTQAVHDKGGTIFTQLWHVGRVSHVSTRPGRAAPVSPTARIAADSQAFGLRDDGTAALVDVSTPRALTTDEVRDVVEDFVRAARNAVEAGFDGIELHGANGYLIEQFLNPHVNDRTDAYRGDTLEGRTRFLLETLDAVIAAIGAERTAVRLSPYGQLHDMPLYPELEETYLYLAEQFSQRGIAYLHIMDQSTRGSTATPADFLANLRARFHGPLILAGGMTAQRADTMIEQGLIDIAAFGEPFIANPDLVDRLRHGWPIETSDRALHYGGEPDKEHRVALNKLILDAAPGVRTVVLCNSLIYGDTLGAPAQSVQIPPLVAQTRESGIARYIGRGLNIWSNVQIADMADLYVLALEKAPAGSFYYVENGETAFGNLVQAIADTLNLGEAQSWSAAEAVAEWGRELAVFALGSNSRIRADKARRDLGWKPRRTSAIDWVKESLAT